MVSWLSICDVWRSIFMCKGQLVSWKQFLLNQVLWPSCFDVSLSNSLAILDLRARPCCRLVTCIKLRMMIIKLILQLIYVHTYEKVLPNTFSFYVFCIDYFVWPNIWKSTTLWKKKLTDYSTNLQIYFWTLFL